jgi:hypothetical protein
VSGWGGRLTRRARAYWRPRILAGIAHGEPLLCPFYLLDPLCPGPILSARDSEWDVDHRDKLVNGGALGVENQHPAHVGCNRRDGQRIAARRKAERVTRIRSWT